MNRVWQKTLRTGPSRTSEMRRAKQLQPVVNSVDALLDIHSMSRSTTAMLICHGLEKERRLSRKMGFPPFVVCGDGYVPGVRLIEYQLFNDPATKNTAIVVGIDGTVELTTPYDHCFLVMPARLPAKGKRLVRLAHEVHE